MCSLLRLKTEWKCDERNGCRWKLFLTQFTAPHFTGATD